MEGSRQNTRLEVFTQVVQAASGISIILGIMLSVWGVYDTLQKANLAVRSVRLSSLLVLKDFVDSDSKIRQETTVFLRKYKTPDELRQVIAKYESGQAAYDSDELADLREIGHHYEQIATLVKLDYVDFDLVYETIPFPDEFWSRTEAFRKEIQTTNWFHKGRGLPDFWDNMTALKARYESARAHDRDEGR